MVQTARAGKWRMVRKQLRIRLDPRLDRTYYDLRPILGQDNGRTRYHIYYGEGHVKDTRHATHIADLPRVTLHPYPLNNHDVATHVQANGDLARIVSDTCAHLSAAAAPQTGEPLSP